MVSNRKLSKDDQITILKQTIYSLLLQREGKLPSAAPDFPYLASVFGVFGGCRHDEVIDKLNSWVKQVIASFPKGDGHADK